MKRSTSMDVISLSSHNISIAFCSTPLRYLIISDSYMEPIKSKYFDSHVHLLDYQPQVLPQILSEAIQAGVEKLVCNTISEDQYQKLEELSLKFGSKSMDDVQKVDIIKSFGIHPYKVAEVQEGWQGRLEQKLKESDKNLVGEIGLDFRKEILEKNPKQKQVDVFDKQVKLACLYNRTMSVHCVRAYGQILKYFKKLAASNGQLPNVVLHSYGGSKQITQSLIKLAPKLNIYFSFCQKRHDDLCEVIPLDRLLFESDAPFQLNRQNILDEKPKCQNINEVKFIRTNAVLHARYNLDKVGFLNEIWKNSLRAFKVLL